MRKLIGGEYVTVNPTPVKPVKVAIAEANAAETPVEPAAAVDMAEGAPTPGELAATDIHPDFLPDAASNEEEKAEAETPVAERKTKKKKG